jgi:hypothetical protein
MKKVKLQYFKQSGKYYAEGEFETDEVQAYHVHEQVRQMQELGTLPGLAAGCREYDIYVDTSALDSHFPVIIRAI